MIQARTATSLSIGLLPIKRLTTKSRSKISTAPTLVEVTKSKCASLCRTQASSQFQIVCHKVAQGQIAHVSSTRKDKTATLFQGHPLALQMPMVPVVNARNALPSRTFCKGTSRTFRLTASIVLLPALIGPHTLT